MGQGQTRALYRGPVTENGQYLTEDAITDMVATDKGYWEYVDAQVSNGRITAQKGMWSWKLAIKFTNQEGSPSTQDPSEIQTSRVTPEPYSFYRARAGGKRGIGIKTIIAVLRSNQAIMLKCLDAQGQVLTALPALLQQAAMAATQVGCQVTQTAAQESAKLLQAGTAPLQQVLDRLSEHSKHETARADDATLAHAKLLLKKQDSDWTDDAIKLVTAAPAVLKLAEKIKD